MQLHSVQPDVPPLIAFESLERLLVDRPVDRIGYIADRCRGKVVLDIGCLDETALQKRDTQYWLHGRIAALAKEVVGLDSSSVIPSEGLSTAPNAIIHRGNGMTLDGVDLSAPNFEVVVAGEFIEHIADPLLFFRNIREALPGRQLIISTPNGVCAANTLMGLIGREVQHPDHLHCFTYKILHTLCLRAGFARWKIQPYRFFATEMILNSEGAKRILVRSVERGIRVVEWTFPLLSFGYIVDIQL